ncbi:E3 ubiquitin-protein ligase XIAP-like, partial [Sinocyclocheilus rhinocerous]|uniref:E3 ubiquitin-protein ligase XIAP-like n=1 Tax=Sinocyclocheilus rhinocerous TaxID=307959 RepID=UPI0007B9F558
LGPNDIVRCFCCGQQLAGWEPGDEAWGEHAKHYSNCFFILGHDVGNVPLTTPRPRVNGQRAFLETFEGRLESFRGRQHPIDPERLARAGFYSSGEQDHVLCFRCGGGLKGWRPDEDPWEQHARHYPGNVTFVSYIFSTEDPMTKLEKLQREKLCKVCMDSDINIVFIPCGHLVTCQKCSEPLNKCPICCAAIMQKIKIYNA